MGKRPVTILSRLPSDLFRTLSEFLDQSQTEIKKTKAVRDYFLHSVKNYSISKFQSNHENSIAIQELKLIQTKKPATSKNVMFYLNLSFQLKIKFRERNSKISQFFLVAFCFFVELFLFCSQSCRNTFF